MTDRPLGKDNRLYTKEKADAYLMDHMLQQINTMIIVQVLAVNYVNQTVDVQPCIPTVYRDVNSDTFMVNRLGEEMPVKMLDMPPITNVPICYQRAGVFMITLPIQVGDTGMLIISKRDISKFKQQGTDDLGRSEVASLRRFDINDGVYLPFVPNMANKDASYSNSALELRAGNDTISMPGDGRIMINGIDFMTHSHSAGSFKDSNNITISGNSGVPH